MSAIVNKFNVRRKKLAQKKEPIQDDFDKPVVKITNYIEKQKLTVDNFIKENKIKNYSIDSITFSVIDKETIDKLSVCEITNVNKNITNIYTTEDPRLGTIENYIQCSTCDRFNENCPGHPAIIRLPVKIIHPFYKDYVIKVLKCICVHCNSLIMSPELIKEKRFLKLQDNERLKAISKESEKLPCRNPNCGVNYKFKNSQKGEKDFRYLPYTIKKGKTEETAFFSVDSIQKNFECMTQTDINILGFNNNHPKNFIIDFIPVIPLSARPYNYMNGEKKDNYITSLYESILLKKIESDQYNNFSMKESNYNDIANIYLGNIIKNNDNNNKLGGRKETGKSIDELVGKKTGLMRQHIMGKRCDYACRTVIGSNRSLNFGYVAPPKEMKNITVPEKITPYNIEFYREYAKRGGIIFLCPSKGNLYGIKLKFNIDKHTINVGDTVHRKLKNGDPVIFNRQPTLHRQGMLGYKCQFQDKYSVGLHLSSTSGHNADFDGDEGNEHIPQDIKSQMEVRTIMSSENCIMSFTYSAPQAALVYNSISSAYLLTKDETFLTKEEFYNGLAAISEYSKTDYSMKNFKNIEKLDEFKNNDLVGGKLFFSVLLPSDFYYNKDKVKIVNGILKTGPLKKADVGESSNSIIQNLWKWYGKKITSNFISDSNFLLNWYIKLSGMTVGIKDCMPNNRKKFAEEKEKIFNNVFGMIKGLPPLANNASIIDLEERENRIIELLRKPNSKILKIFMDEFVDKDNNSLINMYESGAKGKKKNISDIICLLGQTFVDNKRPRKTLSNKQRWLTTFSVEDESPESRGFVKSSFLEGLEPDEYFAQAQSGRIGLIGTAVMTRKSGEMNREIIKAQEDLVLQYDGSVRNQSGAIFQFCYGSGLAPQHSVIDKTINGENLYSFFNSKELCGRINSKSGVEYSSLTDLIKSNVNNVNKQYKFEITKEESPEEDEDNIEKYAEAFDEDDDEGDMDMDFDD